MRRRSPLLPALLLPGFLLAGLLTACEEADAPTPRAGAHAAFRAAIPARGLVDTIVIEAVDRLPLRAAELVAPDGSVTPAGPIDVVADPSVRSGQFAVGNVWQNALAGNGQTAAAPANLEAGAALRSQTQLLAVMSNAEIALPDAVAYRREWQNYRVRLSFGTPPTPLESRDIPAPEPLPE